ncbi:MAG: LuxR C-terminal-related transcriptional regulator [Planctomycetota bacterium]
MLLCFSSFIDAATYRAAVTDVEQVLCDWLVGPKETSPDIEQFSFPVYVKNRERVLTLVNRAYSDCFSYRELPIGKHCDNILHESVAKVSAHSDSILFDGYSRLELEHAVLGPDNHRYLVRTYKVDVSGYRYEPYAILGVSIPLRVLGESNENPLGIEDLFAVYAGLDRDDKRICTMYALGETTRAIAEELGKSAKTIENHRCKIMNQLGLSKPVEIIRLLVRFEERGYLTEFTDGIR